MGSGYGSSTPAPARTAEGPDGRVGRHAVVYPPCDVASPDTSWASDFFSCWLSDVLCPVTTGCPVSGPAVPPAGFRNGHAGDFIAPPLSFPCYTHG
jgi:hypothetical protein